MKKNIRLLALSMGMVLAVLSQSVVAQNHWSIELRPAINFPMKDLGNADLNNGFGLEGVVAYKFMPHLAVYGGWSWNRFSADQSFLGNDIDFEETGYSFGLQFIHPISNSKIGYMINGGGTYHHIEAENSEGKIINDTGHGLGWQLGAGITIQLSDRWMIIPGIRYRSLSRDIKTTNAVTPVELNYLSAGLGISYAF